MTMGSFVPKALGYLMSDRQEKELVLCQKEVVRQQKKLLQQIKELKIQKRLKEYDKELVEEEQEVVANGRYRCNNFRTHPPKKDRG